MFNKGMVVDGFELLDTLDTGGCGRVWLAKDLNDQALYALKELVREDQLQRFRQEVEILQSARELSGIVRVWPFMNLSQAPYYYVMEYAELGDLEKMVFDEKPEFGILLRALAPVITALGVLHAEGRVHRDIKPKNILRCSRGLVISDFGIAKSPSNGITIHGDKLGSAFFTAPEQELDPRAATAASDQYSLAAVFVWCIGSMSKNAGDWNVASAIKVSLRKALRKDPSKRWRGIAEFFSSLVKAVSKSAPIVCLGVPAAPLTPLRLPPALIASEDDWWKGNDPDLVCRLWVARFLARADGERLAESIVDAIAIPRASTSCALGALKDLPMLTARLKYS